MWNLNQWNADIWDGGSLSISGNAGIAGATVSYSGVTSGSVIADGSGNFTIPGLSDGPYTITPSKTGYTFSPTSSNQTLSGSNITGVNFTASSSAGSSTGWMGTHRDFVNKRGIYK